MRSRVRPFTDTLTDKEKASVLLGVDYVSNENTFFHLFGVILVKLVRLVLQETSLLFDPLLTCANRLSHS